MRALKKGKYGTVQYVSENYVVRNKDLISKHVFAGNTRLVSNMVMKEEKSGKMVATEQGAYYYHPDHLGSSSVVTDKAGKFYEQIEYFPYGETWINNKATAEQESTPYKFTGKEYDPETGWYYFGWRYFDPKLSRWVSADPPLARGDYLPVPPVSDKAKERNSNLPGMGGVFNTINIDAYHYAGDNPVKYIDPDGNFIHIIAAAIVGGAVNGLMVGISGGSVSDILAATGVGFVSGGVIGATMGGSLAANIVLGSGISMVNSAATQLVTGTGEINGGDVIASGLLGGGAGFLSSKFGSLVNSVVKDISTAKAWNSIMDAFLTIGGSSAEEYIKPSSANASENPIPSESILIDRARGDRIMSDKIDSIMKQQKNTNSHRNSNDERPDIIYDANKNEIIK